MSEKFDNHEYDNLIINIKKQKAKQSKNKTKKQTKNDKKYFQNWWIWFSCRLFESIHDYIATRQCQTGEWFDALMVTRLKDSTLYIQMYHNLDIHKQFYLKIQTLLVKHLYKKSLKIPKEKSETLNQSTDNTMKDNKTNNRPQSTMQNTKDWEMWTPLKTQVLQCPRMVSSPCSTNGTRSVTRISNANISTFL